MFYWLEVKRKVLYMRLQEISLCVYTGLSKPQFLFILVQLNPLLTLFLNLNIQILSLKKKKKITYLAVWSVFKHMEINLKWLFNTGCTSLENSLSFLGSYCHIFYSSPLASDRALYSKEKYLILLLSSLPTPHFVYPLCPLFCLCFYLRPTLSLNLFLVDCYLKEFMLS